MPPPRVTVTPAAEKFMRQLVRFSEHPAGGFRLRLSPGGCSGYASEFTVEGSPHGGDSELEINGLRLFLAAESRLLLDGATVDFSDTPLQSGLTFVNPNQAVHSCATSGDARRLALAAVSLASIKRR